MVKASSRRQHDHSPTSGKSGMYPWDTWWNATIGFTHFMKTRICTILTWNVTIQLGCNNIFWAVSYFGSGIYISETILYRRDQEIGARDASRTATAWGWETFHWLSWSIKEIYQRMATKGRRDWRRGGGSEFFLNDNNTYFWRGCTMSVDS